MTDAANGDTLLVWQIERLWNGRVVLSGRCTSTMAYNMALDVVRDFNGKEARNYSAPHLADWVDAKPGHRFNLGCGSEEVGYGGMRALRLPDHDSAPEGKPRVVTPATDMAPALQPYRITRDTPDGSVTYHFMIYSDAADYYGRVRASDYPATLYGRDGSVKMRNAAANAAANKDA